MGTRLAPLEYTAATIAFAAALLAGCATTPGREQPIHGIMDAVASPDGKLVAASTGYEEVALFELAPLKFRALLTRPSDRRPKSRDTVPVAKPFPFSSPQLAFSPDGSTVVASGVAGHVVAWDVNSGAERFRAPLEEGVLDLAFFPDGRAFVTAGPNVVLWAPSDGARIAELQLPAAVQAMSVAVSPDGRILLAGLSNGNIAVYDAASRQLLRTLEDHAAPVYGLAFYPDGSSFASTAGQYDPRIWKKDVTGEYGKGERAAVGAAAAAQPTQDQAQALGLLVWLLGAVGQMHVVGAPLGVPPIGSGLEAVLAAAPKKVPKFCAPRVAFSPDGRYLASSAGLMENPYGSLVDPGMPIFLTDLKMGGTKAAQNFGCAVAFTADSKYVIARESILAAPTFWDVETLQRVDLSTPRKQ